MVVHHAGKHLIQHRLVQCGERHAALHGRQRIEHLEVYLLPVLVKMMICIVEFRYFPGGLLLRQGLRFRAAVLRLLRFIPAWLCCTFRFRAALFRNDMPQVKSIPGCTALCQKHHAAGQCRPQYCPFSHQRSLYS